MVLIQLTDQKPDFMINATVAAVIADAQIMWAPLLYEGEFPTTGFGIAELRPKHVYSTAGDMAGSAYWSMSLAAGSTWYDWISVSLTDMAYIIITGLINLSPAPQVTEIKPRLNGQDGPVINIEQMYALDLARAFLPRPYSVKPSGTLVMRASGRQAVTDERLGLLGYEVGKRSYLITE